MSRVNVILAGIFAISCSGNPTHNAGSISKLLEKNAEPEDSTKISTADIPELSATLSFYHRGLDNIVSDEVQLRARRDTVHFLKRKYSHDFRIYRLQFNQSGYTIKSLSLTSFQKRQKLHTSHPELKRTDTGVAFMDDNVNHREDHIRIDATFQTVTAKVDSSVSLLVILDRDKN